ncbi:MAG: GNAT family N-acetyltransferase [Acidimicrobiia bacterium]
MAPLEDGWTPETPENDSLLRGYVAGFADLLSGMGRATGARVLEDDEVVALDVGADFFLANGAVLRRPVRDTDLPGVVDRLHDFYAAGPGVGWMLLSAWPIPPIERMFLIGHPPFMVRMPGGEAPPIPPGLTVREARDEAGMADFARALEGYPATGTEVFADARILDVPGVRVWVGYLDGRPVACAGAHVNDVCVDVEWVATHEDVRGRGFGAAVTWAATLAAPDTPAVLIASDPGQPVYERMGYVRLMRLTMWGAAPS